jgi:hypothetical protein
MKLVLLKRAIYRNLNLQTLAPYQKFLRAISKRGDVWVVSQGEYILWWQKRASSDLRIVVSNKECHVTTNLSKAVMENYPNDFYASPQVAIPCPESNFDGPILLTIDKNLKQKELFKEALRREGILNYTEGANGAFFFSKEVSLTLEKMAAALKRSRMEDFHQCVGEIRQLIVERLAQRGVPLLRIWYHPCVEGKIIRFIISPRYDVDRAITNMPRIWDLEHKYQASSTAHLRPSCPFYNQRKIKEIIRHPTCPEIALHGEFVGHASRFGGLLEAAIAEKKKLEEITGREILGVSLHGGELIENNTAEAQDTVPKAGFLYDASMGPTPYYFPYRLQKEDETFEITYRMHTNFGDIRIPYSKGYAEGFFNEAIHQANIASKHNGILVMLLHPIYFGSWSYLLNFENLVKFFTFLPTYLSRLVKSKKM